MRMAAAEGAVEGSKQQTDLQITISCVVSLLCNPAALQSGRLNRRGLQNIWWISIVQHNRLHNRVVTAIDLVKYNRFCNTIGTIQLDIQ